MRTYIITVTRAAEVIQPPPPCNICGQHPCVCVYCNDCGELENNCTCVPDDGGGGDIETLTLAYSTIIQRPAGTYNISIPSGTHGTVMVNNVNGGQNINTANDVITARNSGGGYIMGRGGVVLNNVTLLNAAPTGENGALAGAAESWWAPLFNVNNSLTPITGTITVTSPFRIAWQW